MKYRKSNTASVKAHVSWKMAQRLKNYSKQM